MRTTFRATLEKKSLDTLRNNGYFSIMPEPLDGPNVRMFLADHDPPYRFVVTIEEKEDNLTRAQMRFAHVVIRKYAQFQAWSEYHTKSFLKSMYGIKKDLIIQVGIDENDEPIIEHYHWLASFTTYTVEQMGEFLNLCAAHLLEAGVDIEEERERYLAHTRRLI